MNFKQLRYVLVLANTGSFSEAANVLNISQPSLSQYIKKIEKQIGIELFDRTNGNVKITDAGEVYIEIGRKILNLEKQMQNRFMDISLNKCGTIVIGTTPYRSASFMPQVVAEFRKQYPGICLMIKELETFELFEAAAHGDFDLCVTAYPVDERLFDCITLKEEELVVAVHCKSEADSKFGSNAIEVNNRKYKAIDAKLLDNETFVTVGETQVMQKALANICIQYDINIVKSAVVKSMETQIEMVKAGIGAALVPEGIEKFAEKDGCINFYSLIQDLPRRNLSVAFSKDKFLSEPMRNLIDIMKKS